MCRLVEGLEAEPESNLGQKYSANLQIIPFESIYMDRWKEVNVLPIISKCVIMFKNLTVKKRQHTRRL